MTNSTTTYMMIEKENFQSFRKYNFFEAKSLTSAKRIASKKQCFENTVLVLYNHETGKLLATKDADGKWKNTCFI